jgi:hypothetical protein
MFLADVSLVSFLLSVFCAGVNSCLDGRHAFGWPVQCWSEVLLVQCSQSEAFVELKWCAFMDIQMSL